MESIQRVWANYEIASKLKTEEPELRVAILLSCVSKDAIDIFDGFSLTDDESNDMDSILGAFEKFCIGETNKSYERFVFNSGNKKDGESVDVYGSELRTLAKTCNVEHLEESLTRDKFITGTKCDITRRRLFQEPKLTLPKCIDIARAIESSNRQVHTMHEESNVHKDDQIVKKVTMPSRTNTYDVSQPQDQSRRGEKVCLFSGSQHASKKELFPAWEKQFTKCKGRNNFARMCKSRVRAFHVNGNDDDLSDDDSCEDAWLAVVSKGLKKSKSTARLITNDQEVCFKIDAGAEVNTICQNFVRKDQVGPVT